MDLCKHVPKVRILQGPPLLCYDASVKKRVFVQKEKFDAVLSALLKSKPIERKKIKTSGKHGPKTPLFQKQ